MHTSKQNDHYTLDALFESDAYMTEKQKDLSIAEGVLYGLVMTAAIISVCVALWAFLRGM